LEARLVALQREWVRFHCTELSLILIWSQFVFSRRGYCKSFSLLGSGDSVLFGFDLPVGHYYSMGRLARFVVPGLPHHVTQRGNGRAQTFFGDGDYALYRDLLATSCHANHVEIWSWVLMPNHIHLILWPVDADGRPGQLWSS
jgi:hypothetical protein